MLQSIPRICGPLALLVLTAAAGAQIPASRPAARKPGPWVTVLDLTGRTYSGQLQSMTVPGSLRLASADKTADVDAAQVIWIGFDLRPQPDPRPVQWFSDPPVVPRQKRKPPVQVRVTLRDGQALTANLQEPRGPESLALDHRTLGTLDLPFQQLREVILPNRSGAGSPAAALADAAMDVLSLNNGDRVEGILHSLAPATVTTELASGEKTTIPTNSVLSVRLAEASPATAPASQPAAVAMLRLHDGQRIAVSRVNWDAVQSALSLVFRGRTITIPATDLAGIEPLGANWQWLTSLPAGAYDHQPLLSPVLTWQPDATASGQPVACSNNPVLRAIGMPLGSTLRYDLDGTYSRLIVWPLLDDSTAPSGAARARILLDGQEAWQGTIKPSTLPVAVIVNLAGKRQLTLKVDSAETGDVLTRFAWAWPVVAR